jgi:hypothetical protein
MQPEPGVVVERDLPVAPSGVRRALPMRRLSEWPAETWWVIAAAGVSSVLALLTWGGLLWRYVQPSAFNGRMALGPVRSLQFALFVAGAAAHAVVLVGIATVPFSRRAARALLLVGAGAVVVLTLYQFINSAALRSGFRAPSRGPDHLVSVASAGAWFVTHAIPHLLLMYSVARRPQYDPRAAAAADAFAAETEAPSAELGYFPGENQRLAPERTAIVLLAGANSVAAVLEDAAILWIMLAPQSFKTIGATRGWYETLMLAIGGALNLAVVCGVASLLLRRRSAGRRLLLAGAGGIILFYLYGQTHFLFSPPRDYPRYVGAERLVDVVGALARFGAAVIVYALAVAAVGRRSPRAGTPPGVLP